MGPTETGSAAVQPKALNELLHAVPCLLRRLLQFLLHAVDLRLDRLLQLRAEPGRPGLGVLAVRLDRALRAVALQPQEAGRLVATLAHHAVGRVPALAQLAQHAVARDRAAALEP